MRRVVSANSRRWSAVGALLICAIGLTLMGGRGAGPRGGGKPAGGAPAGVPSTIDDFFLPGTQPLMTNALIQSADNCFFCHSQFPDVGLPIDAEPWFNWAGTMMANSARDPLFWACLTIANQDAPESADLCLRCHTPGAWLEGRSTPTDGSMVGGGSGEHPQDFEGVTCHVCHRMVNPVYVPGSSPAADQLILDELEDDPVFGNLIPPQPHTATYVIDPEDVRRGPFDLVPGFPFHLWAKSPFHKSSNLCGTCHDVSNPLFVKSGDLYLPAADSLGHPSQDKYEMFPLERTFSEWEQSQFANGGVPRTGGFANFGGALPPEALLSSCQDCHMPDIESRGCIIDTQSNVHPDMPQHAFAGGNTWVMRAAKFLYEDGDPPLNDHVFEDQFANPSLTDEMIEASISRATAMLRNAADVDLEVLGSNLRVRITNYSGHKLPTGYGEGRRMWINVKYFNSSEQLIQEHGEYGFGPAGTAILNTGDTKVYELKQGLDANMAALTGKPQGESFHFVLNNQIILDNRIPPVGFTNAGFAAVQAQPVGYAYADGQNWDQTDFAIPSDASRAVVTLYYQTASKEYMEFLRDENATDNRGQIAYNMWADPAIGAKSAPVDIDSQEIIFGAVCVGDTVTTATFNPPPDGSVNAADLAFLLGEWGPNPGSTADIVTSATFQPPPDGVVDAADLAVLLGNWGICD